MKLTSPKKPTKDCFTDFAYRSSYFDTWLPKTQPAQKGEITVWQFPKPMTFKEIAVHFFGSDDIEVIKKHVLTLPMVEKMIAERASELETSGWNNFFFVKNDDGGVSVGYVRRDERRWRAIVSELSRGSRWSADGRLLVCNLDTGVGSDALALSPDAVELDHERRIAKLEAIIGHHNLGI